MKKEMKAFCLLKAILSTISILLLSIPFGYSQSRLNKIDSIYAINGMNSIAMKRPSRGWIHFKEGLRFNETTFFEDHKSKFGLRANDKMKVEFNNNDEYGYTHTKYSQTYQGLNVEFSTVIVHSKNGYIEKVNGEPALNLTINIQPKITSEKAIKTAISHINAEIYAWESKNPHFKKEYPKSELVILPQDEKLHIDKDYLAYKIQIVAIKPQSNDDVYVDALTGEILFINSISKNDYAGTAATLYSETENIMTSFDGTYYYLSETGRGGGINTYNCYNTETGYTVLNSVNSWSNKDAENDAHWAAEETYDFYKNMFNRNSFDNNGGEINNFTHVYINWNNAMWDGSEMLYGDGDGITYNPLVSIDIIGHELTHAVTQYTANLAGTYEPGALNEGFSDIMGYCIKVYAKPSTTNWTIGEDITVDPNDFIHQKSLKSPKLYGFHPTATNNCQVIAAAIGWPDTYGGNNWYTLPNGCNPDQNLNDNGWVHGNSAVLSHWFYLLSQGGSGTNDNGTTYNVVGIGLASSEAIAYRTLTTYLTSNSNYSDTREASIEAAIDIFGSCSNEVTQLVNAWNAVGVNGPTNIATNIDIRDVFTNGVVSNGSNQIASNSITASNKGSVTINSSVKAYFRSGNSTLLLPGFLASSGCVFEAIIGNCNGGGILKSSIVENSNTSNSISTLNIPEESTKVVVEIYPNPTKDIFKLIVNKESIVAYQVLIYDINGKVIFEKSYNHNSIDIDLSNQNAGMYIIKVISDKDVFTKRIIKQ